MTTIVRYILLRMILKLADVNNPSRHLHDSVAWSMRMTKEFEVQGEREAALGLPISTPFASKSNRDLPKNQVSKLTNFFMFSSHLWSLCSCHWPRLGHHCAPSPEYYSNLIITSPSGGTCKRMAAKIQV